MKRATQEIILSGRARPKGDNGN